MNSHGGQDPQNGSGLSGLLDPICGADGGCHERSSRPDRRADEAVEAVLPEESWHAAGRWSARVAMTRFALRLWPAEDLTQTMEPVGGQEVFALMMVGLAS